MDGSKKTLLIIEDEELNRNMLEEILSEEYVILTAENGEEGLRVLKDNADDISVVLLDIRMPVMNGYDFLKEQRRDGNIAAIPVIVISSEPREYAEAKCVELGAIDYLVKPYNAKLVQVRVRTVSRMYEASKALKVLEIDELTGLYTKQAFMNHAYDMVMDNRDIEYGILAFDIENFKLANNQYGEAKCDEFLAYIGKIVREKLGADGIAGRFGGDQFVVLFEVENRLNPFPAKNIYDDLVNEGPIPHQVINKGIYAPITPGTPIVRCCDRAFLAINEIKGVYGHNIAFYDDKMRELLEEQQELQDAMETALKEKQFKVYYQPKHDSMSGKVSGAEALIRWIHPEWGFMSPGKFIPLFEKNGFITRIDSFVVDRVCQDIIKWQKQGIEVLPISINVSRRDYYESGWLDSQIATIDKYGIDHRLIHIEVTESLYAENPDVILEQVKKVRDENIMIEMDDFGAGYSSLGMLATFTFDIIKLDISFVRKIEVNRIVIESIINLAHRMGFKTIAEGVETEQQFMILKELGCDYIQGYYFSKPLPEEEFEKYIKRSNV